MGFIAVVVAGVIHGWIISYFVCKCIYKLKGPAQNVGTLQTSSSKVGLHSFNNKLKKVIIDVIKLAVYIRK